MNGKIGAAASAGKFGRNDPCSCGSGRKYKHCCASKETGRNAGADNAAPLGTAKAQAIARRIAANRLWAEGKREEALVAFEDAARLDPCNPDAHFDLGVARFRNARLSQAAESFMKACELRPRCQKALRALASIFEHLGLESEASSAFRRLSRMTDDMLERRFFLAKALVLDGDLDEAETELQRALSVAPDYAPARALLGHLLSERGMFEAARPHLMSVINTLPDVFHSLANSKRMTKEDRPLVERMRSVAEQADLNPIQKAAIHFGLGKAFNDFGDYEQAMRHYDEGNRLKAASNRVNRAATAALYRGLMSDFTRESLERRRVRFARPLRPDDDLPVFIVGMMRSGSTLVEQILSSHPAVASGGELPFWADRVKKWLPEPPKTESDFTPPPLDWTARAPLVKGSGPMLASGANNWVPTRFSRLEAEKVAEAAEDYLALLRRIGPNTLRVTDKALSNFERLGTIHLALPQARIIHCRRHPVDTCLSVYFANIKGRHVWDRSDLVFWYRQYERMMEHWRRVLPPERFTEVQYETLVADREAESRRLISFLGLEWDDACLAPERNARAVKTASVWQVRQPVYKTSVERWRRYEPWLGELRELLAKDAPVQEPGPEPSNRQAAGSSR